MKKKIFSKWVTQEHAAGRKVVNPPSKRKSKWRGARGQGKRSSPDADIEINPLDKILD